MKADEAHKRALADYKASNPSRLCEAVASAAAASAAAAAAGSASQAAELQPPPPIMENIAHSTEAPDSTTGPVFPTASSVVGTGGAGGATGDMARTWTDQQQRNFAGFSPQSENKTQMSVVSAPQQSNPSVATHKKSLQNDAQATITFCGVSAPGSGKEARPLSERKKAPPRKHVPDSSSATAQQKRTSLIFPQGLSSGTVGTLSQFPPNTITPTQFSDSVFPAGCGTFPPPLGNPLGQLALPGGPAMMLPSPPRLVPRFPARSAGMTLPTTLPPRTGLSLPHVPQPSRDQAAPSSTSQN